MLNMEFADMQEKLHETCNQNDLEFSFNQQRFPIIATLKPSEKNKNQMVMDLGEDKSNFVNGEIQFIFGDELSIKIMNDFKIADGLLNKIKNQTKKLHYVYLQLYFKDINFKKNNIGGYLNDIENI